LPDFPQKTVFPLRTHNRLITLKLRKVSGAAIRNYGAVTLRPFTVSHTLLLGDNLRPNRKNVEYVRIAKITAIIMISVDGTLSDDTAEVCRAVLDAAAVEYEGTLADHVL